MTIVDAHPFYYHYGTKSNRKRTRDCCAELGASEWQKRYRATLKEEELEETQISYHSEVMHAILEKFSLTRCTCGGPSKNFHNALLHYTFLRKAFHRTKKFLRMPYSTLEFAGQAQARIRLETLANEITMARHNLERLSPCDDCIRNFNPTGRLSETKIWNPHRARAYKEALS